jgi:type IV pilus assembly protein PilV
MPFIRQTPAAAVRQPHASPAGPAPGRDPGAAYDSGAAFGQRAPTRLSRAGGFSMLEILVVLLILSFGLLGLAGLQAATVKYKTNAWVRSATANLFTDMADRIRANPNQTGAAYGSGSSTASAYLISTTWTEQQSETPTIARNCLSLTCTDAQRAAFDLASWQLSARRLMPQGSVNIEGNRASGVTLTLAWFDKDNSSTAPEICAATTTGMAAANCCPTALSVASTNGVRCLRMTLIP